MNNTLLLELIGIPAIYIGGVFFHFLYKYFGKRKWMVMISPVNESLWEHLKLTFYPTLAYSLIQFLILRDVSDNYLVADLIGIYVMMLFILITELIYPLILKKNIFILDLLIFLIAICISQLLSYYISTQTNINFPNFISYILILFQTILFIIFSFKPLKINIFKDSVDNKYGIK